MMDAATIRTFCQYLRNCNDEQVRGVYEKETAAGRTDYAELAYQEMITRGIA